MATNVVRDGRGPGSVVAVTCTMCKKLVEIPMDLGEWRVYSADVTKLPRGERRHIQDYFPGMSPAHREMFISGTCPTCWDAMFPPDFGDDDEGGEGPQEA